MSELIYWIDEYVDEVVPCNCTLQGWADWLAKPSAEAEADGWPREDIADGAEFAATVMQIGADIAIRFTNGAWEHPQPPIDADFFAIRHGPGLGWDGERSADELDVLLEVEAECAEEGDEELIAVGTSLPTVRIRFELTSAGPRCVVIGAVQ